MNFSLDKITAFLLKGFGSQKMEDIGFLPFLMLLVISLLSAMLISRLYLRFFKNRATGSQIHRAFPLLGIAVTAIFICIQFSLPLSLGLLGALSIVRFRTPIKEPEEIGFIMIVIATSICCATFNILFLAIILIVTYAGLILTNRKKGIILRNNNDGLLTISVPSDSFQNNSGDIFSYLKDKLPDGKISSIAENNKFYVISYDFKSKTPEDTNNIAIGLKKIDSEIKANLFYSN